MVGAAGIQVNANDTSTIYSDMKTHWARPFVNEAETYLTGYNDASGQTYRPDTPALREDVAVALVKLKGYSTSLADLSILENMFGDVTSISEGLKPYVAVAVEQGLISGYEDGTFRGQDTLTRAEASAMLWRAFQYGNMNKTAVDGTGMLTPQNQNQQQNQDQQPNQGQQQQNQDQQQQNQGQQQNQQNLPQSGQDQQKDLLPEVITGDKISGHSSGINWYSYTAPVSGRYGFRADSISGGSGAEITFRDANGKTLSNNTLNAAGEVRNGNVILVRKTNSSSSMDFEAGRSYLIEVKTQSGTGSYSIKIDVPKQIAEGQSVSGTISDSAQVDRYYFTASSNGEYLVFLQANKDYVKASLFAADGMQPASASEIEAGKTYCIEVISELPFWPYTLKVAAPADAQ
jgi:hypothetical protein